MLAATVAVTVLAGCGGGGSAASSTDNAAAADTGARGSAVAAGNSADSLRSGAGARPQVVPRKDQPAANITDVTPRVLVKTAALSLQVSDLSSALQQISDATVVANGEIASEQTSTNRHGQPVHSRLVVRVPVDNFEATLTKLAAIGQLQSLARSVVDVTGDVADINSRVQSAQDSISQLRRLFSAAKRLGQVIELENELSQREADLEALQAQQRALADQTQMSTITVTVSQLPHSKPPASATDRAGGFLSGLKSGWHALGVLMLTAGNAVGLALPFAVTGLLAFAVAWLVVRRVRPSAPPRPSE